MTKSEHKMPGAVIHRDYQQGVNMHTIGIDGPGCSCDGEGCSLCTALDESCEACGAVLTDANRGDGIGDLCATFLAAGALPVAELRDAEVA